MGCHVCNQNNQVRTVSMMEVAPITVRDEECVYELETINDWKIKLECTNEKNLLPAIGLQKALYNSFLGILISIQFNPNNVCYFKKELDIINPYILNIISEDVC